jgi:hypothetical protein
VISNVTGMPVVVLGGVAVTDAISRALRPTVVSPSRAPARAVTTAWPVVVSVVVAIPFASVTAVFDENDPLVVVKVTVIPGSAVPASVSTRAVTVVVPPEAPRFWGLADTAIRPAAAVPTARLFSVPTAPPEYAVITAVPFWPSAKNRTRTSPFCVRASLGSIRPIVVVKETRVPL